MKLFSSKRRIVAAAALIVLALFLLRPGASRLQSRIASSISSAVGRPVEIGPVHLRLLPQPGFDLENLVVYDDPAFGAEPMLRASEVTANLRLISLMRGRLEISRLDLTEPSLNLVQAEDGRWNLEALLERTAHIPLAPTAKPKSEARPGFPYIQATSARINFKNGPEKKPYALTNADFSLWQDSENSWGVRLKAQPFRSDLNLNDMGMLQVIGNVATRGYVARNSDAIPGGVESRTTRPTVESFLQVTTKAGAETSWSMQRCRELRRNCRLPATGPFKIFDGTTLRVGRRCGWRATAMGSTAHSITKFTGFCVALPVGSGMITVQGDMGLPRSASYALTLTADNVPASAAAMLVQRVKKNLPEDLVADGTMWRQFAHGAKLRDGVAVTLRRKGRIRRFARRLDHKQGRSGAGDASLLADFRRFRDGSGVAKSGQPRQDLEHAISGWPACRVRALSGDAGTYAVDRSGMGEPRWLQPVGCGRGRDCESVACSSDARTSGIAIERRGDGAGGSANRGIVGGAEQWNDFGLHWAASDGHGEVAECSHRHGWRGKPGRSRFGRHATFAGRDPCGRS